MISRESLSLSDSFHTHTHTHTHTHKQVFLVRKVVGKDAGKLYAMKVLKKASLKGESVQLVDIHSSRIPH